MVTSPRCSPTRSRCPSARGSVVGVEQAGLEPFVPRVTLTFPALVKARADRVPGHRGSPRRTRWRRHSGRTPRPDPHVPSSLLAAAGQGGQGAARSRGSRASAVGRGAVVSAVIGVDLGGTKVVVACLRGREIGESRLEADRPFGQRGADRPARGSGQPHPVRRSGRDRDRRSLGGRLRDGAGGVVGQHPADRRAAAPGSRRAARRARVRRQRCHGGGARRGARLGAPAGGAQSRDAHRRDRRGRRNRARRPDLPRRHRGRGGARPHARRPRVERGGARPVAGAGVSPARIARVRGGRPRAGPAGRAGGRRGSPTPRSGSSGGRDASPGSGSGRGGADRRSRGDGGSSRSGPSGSGSASPTRSTRSTRRRS